MGVPAVVSGAPADIDDLVLVTWNSLDEDTGQEEAVEEGPLQWCARAQRLPAEGDNALLFLDQIGTPWALVWATGAL